MKIIKEGVSKQDTPKLKTGLTLRGDSLYCPLSLSLDAYGNCLNDCYHCYLRRLNHVWGKELKPLDIEILEKQMRNGLFNQSPRSSMAFALKQKKTVRFGNKSDPFQEVEREWKVSEKILLLFKKLGWSLVIQTMMTEVMMDYEGLIEEMKDLIIIQPIISCGLEKDWEILERKRTTPIDQRISHIEKLKHNGVRVAVNGEPFIPGYHTEKQFEDMLKLLKSSGIGNYNIYSFHFNDFVAKRLNEIGIDIQKIWYFNQDAQWKLILGRLIDLAKKYSIVLGCPDFVNSGPDYVEQTNTCCGIDVSFPTTFNVITWKRRIQNGENPEFVFEDTWDGVGDKELGRKVFDGTSKDMYTLLDTGVLDKKKKDGLLF